jgi:hypothetical protein
MTATKSQFHLFLHINASLLCNSYKSWSYNSITQFVSNLRNSYHGASFFVFDLLKELHNEIVRNIEKAREILPVEREPRADLD